MNNAKDLPEWVKDRSIPDWIKQRYNSDGAKAGKGSVLCSVVKETSGNFPAPHSAMYSKCRTLAAFFSANCWWIANPTS